MKIARRLPVSDGEPAGCQLAGFPQMLSSYMIVRPVQRMHADNDDDTSTQDVPQEHAQTGRNGKKRRAHTTTGDKGNKTQRMLPRRSTSSTPLDPEDPQLSKTQKQQCLKRRGSLRGTVVDARTKDLMLQRGWTDHQELIKEHRRQLVGDTTGTDTSFSRMQTRFGAV
jgi:hypothetical protein